jgi:hypothetical protein
MGEITYDFIHNEPEWTGKDHDSTKARPPANIGYIGVGKDDSTCFYDVYEGITNLQSNKLGPGFKAEAVRGKDNLQQQLARFRRDQKDAKMLGVPFEDEAIYSGILNTVIAPYRYQRFMDRNEENIGRVKNFKRGIHQRIQNHLDKGRKSRMED